MTKRSNLMATFTLTNAAMCVSLTQQQETIHLAMETSDGCHWASPLFVFEVYDKAEQRVRVIDRYRIDAIREVDGGLHLTISPAGAYIRAGFWIRLVDGELSVTMPMTECYEDKLITHRLFAVRVLPELMTTDGPGTLFIPVNSGVISHTANKPKLADRFMIYGEQSRWELVPMLPICGAQTPTGGLMALARQGAEETECHVNADGAGSGTVGFAFSLRQFWPDPVEFATREIRFTPMPASADLLHFAAKRLRCHVMTDLGKPTLLQRAQESSEVAANLNAYFMKLFYAVENCGIMMEGKEKGAPITFVNVMTFAEAQGLLARVKAAGIEHVHTQSVGWNPSGHDGLWPTRWPIEERLGGEAAFRALIAFGNELGFTMTVHDNHKSAVRRSPDFREDMVVHDQWGQPMGLGEWGGGITYVLNSYYLPDEWIDGIMRKLKGLGLTGPAYLDGMGNPLHRDYHPAHRLTRTGYAHGTNRLIEKAKMIYGAAGTECGFMYCVIPADSMCTGGADWHMMWCNPEWPITQMLDQRVPAWNLALHDLIMLENQGLGWSTIMHNVLLGLHPRDEWSARPGVMPVLDNARIAQQKAVYDICLAQYGHLQTAELLAYHEPEPGIKTSRFADGTEVIADFTNEELIVNGECVPRPACTTPEHV
jgi:hypothetical protein